MVFMYNPATCTYPVFGGLCGELVPSRARLVVQQHHSVIIAHRQLLVVGRPRGCQHSGRPVLFSEKKQDTDDQDDNNIIVAGRSVGGKADLTLITTIDVLLAHETRIETVVRGLEYRGKETVTTQCSCLLSPFFVFFVFFLFTD